MHPKHSDRMADSVNPDQTAPSRLHCQTLRIIMVAQSDIKQFSCIPDNCKIFCDFHLCEIIRIFHGCEVWIENSAWGSLFGIMRLCRVMPNSDPEGWLFLTAPEKHDRFFFLHTFWSPAFDCNVGVAINESLWHLPYWKLMSYVTSRCLQLPMS